MPSRGEQRLHELVTKLLQRQGPNFYGQWKVTDRTQAYQLDIRSNSLVVSSEYDNGKEPFRLEVFDDRGEVVDTLETKMIHDPMYPDQPDPAPWNGDLEALHERARRDAMNADRVLDSILEGLDEDEAPF